MNQIKLTEVLNFEVANILFVMLVFFPMVGETALGHHHFSPEMVFVTGLSTSSPLFSNFVFTVTFFEVLLLWKNYDSEKNPI